MNKSNEISYHRNNHNTLKIAITILSLLLISSFTLSAQNSWKGGTLGAEQEWNNPKNWSENRVPDWRDETVIIQDVSSRSGYFPTVSTVVPEIGHLRLEGGATLMVANNGKLIVNGETTFNYGILNAGKLVNYGFVSIENTAMNPLENPRNNIINKGAFALIDQSQKIEYLAFSN